MIKKVATILIPVVIGAQIIPPFIGWRFNSFRYLSTAGLLEDELDLLLDPSRYFEVEKNILYTGLSNFATNNDKAFSGLDGPYFMFGFKNTFKPMESPLPLALLYAHQVEKTPELNFLGKEGESEEYISEKRDTDGNGSYDFLRTEKILSSSFSEKRENPFFIGVSKDLGNMKAGLFFFHFKYEESFEPPTNFYYLREERDLVNGILLEKEEYEGSDKRDSTVQGNLFGGSIYIPSLISDFDLGLHIGYGISNLNIKEDLNIERYIDYNPGGTISRVDSIQRNRYELNPGGSLYFLRLFTRRAVSKEANSEDNFYLTFFGLGISRTSTPFEKYQEFHSREDLGTGVLRENRFTDSKTGTLEYERGTRGFILGYRYKGFIDTEKRVYFALGFFLGNTTFNSTLKADSIFKTENYFNDGDDEPLDPDDFTTTTTYQKTNELSRSILQRTIQLPAACEFRMTKSLYFRIGAIPYFVFKEEENTNTPLYSTSEVTKTVRGDGSEVVHVEPVNIDTGTRNFTKSKISGANFSYGLSYKVSENLIMDLMGFANLTDLTNWKVSIIFKF